MAVGNMGNKRTSSRLGQIPVQEGQIYDVEIEGIGEKGDGIAKVQGYVIIVPNVKKGDKVKVKVNAVRGKVSFGEVIGQAETPAGDDEETVDESLDEEEDEEETDEPSGEEEPSNDE